jgi:hypothetical protein
MASRIEHRARFTHTVGEVFAAQTDEHALRARLRDVGGMNPTLTGHVTTADSVRYTLLQGIPAEQLPQLVRTIHSGDITVRREHTWTGSGERYTGTVRVNVSGMPGEITARIELVPDDGGSVQRTHGEVMVRVPLVSGKLEDFVANQVTGLLEREAEFTASWLASHS